MSSDPSKVSHYDQFSSLGSERTSEQASPLYYGFIVLEHFVHAHPLKHPHTQSSEATFDRDFLRVLYFRIHHKSMLREFAMSREGFLTWSHIFMPSFCANIDNNGGSARMMSAHVTISIVDEPRRRCFVWLWKANEKRWTDCWNVRQ